MSALCSFGQGQCAEFNILSQACFSGGRQNSAGLRLLLFDLEFLVMVLPVI